MSKNEVLNAHKPVFAFARSVDAAEILDCRRRRCTTTPPMQNGENERFLGELFEA